MGDDSAIEPVDHAICLLQRKLHPEVVRQSPRAGFALQVGRLRHDVVKQNLVEDPMAGGQQRRLPQWRYSDAVNVVDAGDDVRGCAEFFQIEGQWLAVASPARGQL